MDDKLNSPAPSFDVLAAYGVPALDNSQEKDLSFGAFLRQLRQAAGLNYIVQVNDCETSGDWTESANGTFDYAVGATGKRVGTNCLALTATAACDGSQYVQTRLVDESALPGKADIAAKRSADWSGTRYLTFWRHAESSAQFGTEGELKVAIVNDGILQDKINVEGCITTVHNMTVIDMDVAGWDKGKVESLRFYCSNVNTAEVIYIDDIVRSDAIYDRGTDYGHYYPIKASEALSDGDSVGWSIDGLIKSSSAAAITDLGPVKLFADPATAITKAAVTGTAARSKHGFFAGARIGIVRANAATTAGDYLEWAANGLYTDITTTTTNLGTMIALEAAGAQYDDILVMFVHSGATT